MFLVAAKLWKMWWPRDGIAQHYAALTIPISGVYLDPRLELREAAGAGS
jgi:hypothetical protein